MNLDHIIAVDFDGTLAEDDWPDIGQPIPGALQTCLDLQDAGYDLILWTCRCGKALEEAIDWCAQHGLKFTTINCNLPKVVEHYGHVGRKVSARYYIDDRGYPKQDMVAVWQQLRQELL